MFTEVMMLRVGRQVYWRGRCLSALSSSSSTTTPTERSLPPVIIETEEVIIHSLPVTTLGMNQYLLGCKRQKQAALIDCGCQQPERWVEAATQNGMTITALLQTHGHVDHVCGLKATKELLPMASIHAHPNEWFIFKSAPIQGLFFGLTCPMPPSCDTPVLDGDVIRVGALTVTVRHCPGHSPGHVAFLIDSSTPGAASRTAARDNKPADICTETVMNRDGDSGNDTPPLLLFCGDLIFEGSIGRTDLPGSNERDMYKSLSRLAELPRNTVLLPGHRGVTAIGQELDTNPFLQDI